MIRAKSTKRLIAGILLVANFVLCISLAWADDRVVVAILDAPVDYEHAQISEVLDDELLQKLKFVDESGIEKNWYDLNNEILANIHSRIDEGRYQEQVAFLDGVAALMGGKLDAKGLSRESALNIFKTILKGFFKYLTSKRWRTELDIVGRYLHGTHVAGLVVKSLSNIRLITFPVVDAPKKITASKIWRFDAEVERAKTREYFAQVSEALKSSNTRVVNMSIAASDDISTKSVSKNTSLLTKVLTVWKKRKFVRESARIYKEELERFFIENPRTVFVLAAGNEKTDLDKFARKSKSHTAMARATNVIKVGSVDRTGKISRFSNRSKNHIDVAANGEGVLSAKAGGGEIHMTGTSMAAPIVANRIVDIIVANPAVSAEEAIKKLYQEQVVQRTGLRDFIAGGKVLLGAKADRISLVGLSQKESKDLIMKSLEEFSSGDLPSQVIRIEKSDGSITILEFVRHADGTINMLEHPFGTGPGAACERRLAEKKAE